MRPYRTRGSERRKAYKARQRRSLDHRQAVARYLDVWPRRPIPRVLKRLAREAIERSVRETVRGEGTGNYVGILATPDVSDR
jgi:hypothetical protein